MERLTKKYRLALIDHESLSQHRMIVYKPLYAVLGISFLTILIVGITSVIIIFTPFIREAIPGYEDPQLSIKYQETKEKERELAIQVAQMDSLMQSMLKAVGDDPSGRSVPIPGEIDTLPPYLPGDPGAENGNPAADNRIPTFNNSSIRRNPVMNMMSPLQGMISNEYNEKDKHFGLDIVARENSKILSVSDGYVIFSEYSDQTGYVIGIAHTNGLITFYKHNKRVFKEAGDYVFEGEAIAVIGNTGQNTSGTHLHFEVWDDGQPRNPRDYIVFN